MFHNVHIKRYFCKVNWVWKRGFQLILGLLGIIMYFDAVVVKVKTFFSFIQIGYGHNVERLRDFRLLLFRYKTPWFPLSLKIVYFYFLVHDRYKNWLRAKKIVHDFINNGFNNFIWSFEILLCRMEENLPRLQEASVTTVVEFLKELKWYFTHTKRKCTMCNRNCSW